MQMVFNSRMTTKAMTKTKLKHLREESGFSQIELAERIGYSQASVCRWETGEREIPERAAKLIAIMTYQPEAAIA